MRQSAPRKSRRGCCRCWKGFCGRGRMPWFQWTRTRQRRRGAALDAGAEIINDVSGFTWDAAMARFCAKLGAGVVLMHTRGRPEEWRTQARLEPNRAAWRSVRDGLAASMAEGAGGGRCDGSNRAGPGLRIWQAIRGKLRAAGSGRQNCWRWDGRCWQASAGSRFWGIRWPRSLAAPPRRPHERGNASLAAMTAAILYGASIVRVHAVRAGGGGGADRGCDCSEVRFVVPVQVRVELAVTVGAVSGALFSNQSLLGSGHAGVAGNA